MSQTQNSSNQNATGFQSLNNATGAMAGRTITAGASGAITVTNGSGVAGSPTIDISVPINVANGGTGNTTFTPHALLVGEGTTAIANVGPGTAGQIVLSGGASADPSFISPTAGAGLSITANATTLQYALSSPVSTANGGTGISSPTAHTLPVAEGSSSFNFLGPLTNGQLLVGATGADPIPATLAAGPGISITNGAGTITITSNPLGLPWTDVTGTTQAMLAEAGYLADNATLVTLTLPSTAAQFTSIVVVGNGAGGWKIAQNATQQINFDGISSTAGTGGSLASTNRYDTVELLCVVANTTWNVISSVGNILVT
jgi:hypothetical protein